MQSIERLCVLFFPLPSLLLKAYWVDRWVAEQNVTDTLSIPLISPRLGFHFSFIWIINASRPPSPPPSCSLGAVGVLSKWETILLKVFQCAEQTYKYNYVFQYLGEKKRNRARRFIAAVTVAKNNGKVLTAISVKRKNTCQTQEYWTDSFGNWFGLNKKKKSWNDLSRNYEKNFISEIKFVFNLWLLPLGKLWLFLSLHVIVMWTECSASLQFFFYPALSGIDRRLSKCWATKSFIKKIEKYIIQWRKMLYFSEMLEFLLAVMIIVTVSHVSIFQRARRKRERWLDQPSGLSHFCGPIRFVGGSDCRFGTRGDVRPLCATVLNWTLARTSRE